MAKFFRNSFGEGYEISGVDKVRYLVFFGNASLNFDHLFKIWPDIDFFQTRQVHGNQVVQVQKTDSIRDFQKLEAMEADGMVTRDFGAGLVIKTADCVPVFLVDPSRGIISAIHSGWRGFGSQVVTAAVSAFPEPKDLLVFSGPCIGSCSYEVGAIFFEQFRHLASAAGIKPQDVLPIEDAALFANLSSPNNLKRQDGFKVHLDLKKLLQLELKKLTISWRPNFHSQVDTFNEHGAGGFCGYHSYRRDSAAAGRNLSFVVKLAANPETCV